MPDPTIRVERFAARLAEAFGEQVVSILQYGEAVRGAVTGRRGELSLLVILRNASPETLRPAGRAIAGWVRAGNPPPLIFSEREWRQSTDVFPIEIEEMREAHRLFHGDDPFADLVTTAADLRRELEREVRGKLLQLRAEFAAAESDGRALGDLLEASARTFLMLCRATLRTAGQTPPAEPRTLVRFMAETAGVDAAAFDWVLERLTGGRTRPLAAYDPVAAAYMRAIEGLTEYVNGMVRRQGP
jgi:hypothetical protein